MSRRAAGCPSYSSIVVYTEKSARGFHMTGNQPRLMSHGDYPFHNYLFGFNVGIVPLAITVPALVPGDHVSTAHNQFVYKSALRALGLFLPLQLNEADNSANPYMASCWSFNPIQMRYVLSSYCFRCICWYYNLDLVDMLPCGRPKFPSRQGTCPLEGTQICPCCKVALQPPFALASSLNPCPPYGVASRVPSPFNVSFHVPRTALTRSEFAGGAGPWLVSLLRVALNTVLYVKCV
jgi:hypothetical protein